MDQQTRLKQWMNEHNYGPVEVARRMDVSYELVYLYSKSGGKRSVPSDSFKWRFAQVFGWDEANKVFDKHSEPSKEIA